MEQIWMNKIRETISFLMVSIGCIIVTISNAQNTYSYEFECEYLDNPYICPAHWYGDTVLVISGLFNEITNSNEVVFTFRDTCVFLTIDGQEGLFNGGPEIGSWNNSGNELERFTIKWDSLRCPNNGELIYRFEFIPYYRKDNPYIADDGSIIIREYNDTTIYYWTYSSGVVAMEGDWFFVRKDKAFVRQCIQCFR